MPTVAQIKTIHCHYSEEVNLVPTRCPLLATYIVLLPPEAPWPTPTPVMWEGEGRKGPHAQVARAPVYCRDHAYLVAGVPKPF